MSKFDPKDYIIKISGKDYLKTPHRVLWFKTDHPESGAITTELVFAEPFPLFKAYVSIDGVLMATAHGSAQVKAGSVYAGREFEKAETAAIGRALGNAGYGTQFSEDDEGDDLVDSPVDRKQAPQQKQPQTAKERAIVWINKHKELDATGIPMPTDDNNEVAWKTWCEQVKAKAS